MTGVDILLLAVAVPALAVLVWTDARVFEIDFGVLAVLAAALVAWSALAGPAAPAGLAAPAPVARAAGHAVLADTFGGALLSGGALAVLRRVRPGRMGAGDPWLGAVAGGAAGVVWLAPLWALTALLAVAVSAGYARARGLHRRHRARRTGRARRGHCGRFMAGRFSAFPLAPALCPAALACLAGRMLAPEGWP